MGFIINSYKEFKKIMNNPKLSIIVLSYNTKDILRDCLISLKKVENEVSFEVIVPDNASTDDSPEMVEKEFPWVKVVRTGGNLGFARGNNKARKEAKGEYILFLNSDTIMKPKVLSETIKYLEENKDVGALSCRLVLADGGLDKDARRRFPTPTISLCRLSGLSKFFPNLKSLGRYYYDDVPEDKLQEVEVIQGAYFLTKKEILDKVNWFSEEYFLDGEDIDLCWKIKEEGYKIIYYPKVSIIHLKGASKGKNKTIKKKPPLKERIKFRLSSVNSMEIFYRKRMWKKYPLVVNIVVLVGINLLKLVRLIKVILSL